LGSVIKILFLNYNYKTIYDGKTPIHTAIFDRLTEFAEQLDTLVALLLLHAVSNNTFAHNIVSLTILSYA